MSIRLSILVSYFTLIFSSCTFGDIKGETGKLTEKESLDKQIINDSLKVFIRFFDRKGTKIPDLYCSNYLKIENFGRYYTLAKSKELRRLKSVYLAIVQLNCNAGGYCRDDYMFVINPDGKILNKHIIGYELADASMEFTMNYRFLVDTLLEFKERKIEREYDEDDEQDKLVSDTTIFEYQYIASMGDLEQITNRARRYGKYTETSYRVFEEAELEKLSKDELDIMRNEIFARYGHKFKTEKWKNYFANQSWYIGQYDDVTERLSVIEKLNVQAILEASK